MLSDLKFAARTLRQAPGVAAAAVPALGRDFAPGEDLDERVSIRWQPFGRSEQAWTSWTHR